MNVNDISVIVDVSYLLLSESDYVQFKLLKEGTSLSSKIVFPKELLLVFYAVSL
jgi:hypothetical protein